MPKELQNLIDEKDEARVLGTFVRPPKRNPRKSSSYQKISAYKKYIVELGFPRKMIKEIGISKLDLITRHANKKTKVEKNPLTKALYQKYLAVAITCTRSKLQKELELIDQEEEEEIEPTPEEEKEFSKNIQRFSGAKEAEQEIERLSQLIKGDPVGERIKRAKILARDSTFAQLVKERAKYECEICGAPPFLKKNGKPFAEAHHIYELAIFRRDDPRHMICLCPTCHRVEHYGNEAARSDRRRQGLSRR